MGDRSPVTAHKGTWSHHVLHRPRGDNSILYQAQWSRPYAIYIVLIDLPTSTPPPWTLTIVSSPSTSMGRNSSPSPKHPPRTSDNVAVSQPFTRSSSGGERHLGKYEASDVWSPIDDMQNLPTPRRRFFLGDMQDMSPSYQRLSHCSHGCHSSFGLLSLCCKTSVSKYFGEQRAEFCLDRIAIPS